MVGEAGGFVFKGALWLGGGADDRLDRPEQEDEQRLRETLCERRSVRVRCDDSPHDEAARPSLRTFHTASEDEFYEVRLDRVFENSVNERKPTAIRFLFLLIAD
jgi:hypothetical protein